MLDIVQIVKQAQDAETKVEQAQHRCKTVERVLTHALQTKARKLSNAKARAVTPAILRMQALTEISRLKRGAKKLEAQAIALRAKAEQILADLNANRHTLQVELDKKEQTLYDKLQIEVDKARTAYDSAVSDVTAAIETAAKLRAEANKIQGLEV